LPACSGATSASRIRVTEVTKKFPESYVTETAVAKTPRVPLPAPVS